MEREPSCQPITKMEFEFERRRVTKEDIRELIFREILEYHPQLLKDYINGTERTTFLYPRYTFFLSVVWHMNFICAILLMKWFWQWQCGGSIQETVCSFRGEWG